MVAQRWWIGAAFSKKSNEKSKDNKNEGKRYETREKYGEREGRKGGRQREREEVVGRGGRERKRDSRGREFGVMKEKEGGKKGAANWPVPAGSRTRRGVLFAQKIFYPSPSRSLASSTFYLHPFRANRGAHLFSSSFRRSSRSETNERHPSASPVRQSVRNFWLEANRREGERNENRLFIVATSSVTREPSNAANLLRTCLLQTVLVCSCPFLFLFFSVFFFPVPPSFRDPWKASTRSRVFDKS